MKKLMMMSIFGLMAMAANAAIEPKGTVVTTTCGKQVMTVASVMFGSPEEYQEYLMELNEAHCGSKEMPYEVADRYK